MLSNRNPIRNNPGTISVIRPKVAKMKNAIFEGIKPNVPRFFRIGIRFERILGRWAQFLQKLHFAFFRFDRFDIPKTQKLRNATFEGIKPIVPGFFRIGIRFERIPGRSA